MLILTAHRRVEVLRAAPAGAVLTGFLADYRLIAGPLGVLLG
ncbi:hypothetical protein [Kitasatospora cineracea]|nr:hypothetical protein [Kitasatospora cineracea]